MKAKRMLALMLALTLFLSLSAAVAVSAAEAVSGGFTDVTEDDWFYKDVRCVHDAGLMIGKGDGIFDPDGQITGAEAVTIAARVHSILTTGSPDAADHYQTYADEPWYWTYVNYIDRYVGYFGSIGSYDSPASRRDFARLLASAVGDGAEEINEIAQNAVPDLEENALTAGIYRLYRAGILTGNDERGTFLPDAPIRRSETAAIAARILDPTLRKSITLAQTGWQFDTAYTAPGGWFTLTLPDWWEDEVLIWSGKSSFKEDKCSIAFYCREAVEATGYEYGGFLGAVDIRPHADSRSWPWPVMEIAAVTYPDGQTYDITLHFASDVQYTPGTEEAYARQFRSVQAVAAAMQFPEGCKVTLHEDTARELLQNALTAAYEKIYGPFTPLETKPEGTVPDSEYLRWVIPHLEVSDETDEYYEFPVIFPFRVDKRTGEVFKHYNGLDPFTVPFDPAAPDALAFAG